MMSQISSGNGSSDASQGTNTDIQDLRARVSELENETTRLNEIIRELESERRRHILHDVVAEPPRVLGEKLAGLNTIWIGPCHIEGFTYFAERAGCRASHLLYSSFPFESVMPFDSSAFDCVVAGLTLRHLLRCAGSNHALDFHHVREDWNPDNIESYFTSCHEEMVRQINEIHRASNGTPLFLMPFLEPSFNPLGNLVRREGILDIAEFVHNLNRGMAAHIRKLTNAYFFDINKFINFIGRMHLQDDVLTYYTHASFISNFDFDQDTLIGRIVEPKRPSEMYDQPTRWQMLNEFIWSRLTDNMKIIRQIDAVKLIIVDLDDTLWRGIAAEGLPDNIDNEEYFRTIGWPMALAEALLYFKERGGLLAICSKNDREATLERFKKLWGNRLLIEDFCAVRINWEPKSENIRSILEDVNVLPESVVFIDDNPREIDEVTRVFPQIRTLGFNHYDWRRIILQSPETQVAFVSKESQNRTALIQGKLERERPAANASRAEWLQSMAIRASFSIINHIAHEGYNRAFELINKTNQFNTTGKRWSAAEINRLFSDEGMLVTISAGDRFVDNGVVGVAIMRPGIIEQVVLSCRVFGLGIEDAFLSYIVGLQNELSNELIAYQQPTEKNLASRDYFTRNGFVNSDQGYAVLAKADALLPPEWIEMNMD